mgnify:CR=1 FL=1
MSLFDSGQSVLKTGSTRMLVNLLVGVKAKPGWLIVVAGHTDNTGTPQLNQTLSQKRAEAVRDWMRDTGDVPESCFAVQGYGESRPVASNDTPEGRALNRRVEISLVPQANACQLPGNTPIAQQRRTPMKSRLVILPLLSTLVLGACANMSETQRNTAIGAGIGALGGAVISKSTGGNKTGRDAAIGAGVGALGGYVWSQRMEAQRQAMAQATAGTGVDVTRTADNQLKLEIPSDISFDTGKAAIKPEMRPILDRFAQTLKDNPATNLRIIGHTDSTGSDAINNPLSLERAASARSYLADRGVAPGRIETAGRGAREPVADNGSEAGRAKNRRIEIFVAEAAR